MPPLPANIAAFFAANRVISIAAAHAGEVWSACCFYVFDADAARLIILTSQNTRHGAMMAASPRIAATTPASRRVSPKSAASSFPPAPASSRAKNAKPPSPNTPPPTRWPRQWP